MPMEHRPQPVGGPEDQVDPSEFWQDEPGLAEGYANVYVNPAVVYDQVASRWNDVLNPEFVEWFNQHVGDRRAFGLEWYQNLQSYDWYIRGMTTHNDKTVVQVCIRDLKAAMLFKLRYGGI